MRRYNVILTGIFLVLVSCTDQLSMHLDGEERMVVVYCILQESETQSLQLYYTNLSPDEVLRQPVEAADVRLFCEGTLVAQFTHKESGKWEAEYRPEYGKQYRLEVKVGEKLISAETEFMDKLDFKHPRSSNLSNVMGGIWNIVDKDSQPYRKACHFMVRCWFPSSYFWTNHSGADSFNLTGEQINPELTEVQKRMIAGEEEYPGGWYSKELIEHLVSMVIQQQRVSEILTSWACHKDLVLIHHPANYSNGFSQDELEEMGLNYDNCFFICPVKEGNDLSLPLRAYAEDTKLYVQFLSDSYAAYLESVYDRILNKGDILSELFDYSNCSSNINGGTGVFGSVQYRVASTMFIVQI